MKKCKKCGRPMGNNSYCSVCDKEKLRAAKEQQQANKKKLWLICGIAAACLVILAVVLLLTQCGGSEPEPIDEVPATTLANTQTELSGKHHVEIEIADYGTIKLELDANAAPISVEHFMKLAEEGFYDGLTFHRIMEGFMMQGGDPTGTGFGEPGQETIQGEFAANGVANPLSHTRGAISMARSNDMNSASSQFFIVHQDSTFLDGNYACFGYVTEGMDVVDAVCTSAEPIDDNGTIPAENQPIITAIRVID